MELICPICGGTLRPGEHQYSCENRHGFDVARQGYVNLLTVQQKRSLHPGDTREQVISRRAFLDGGFYAPIARALCEAAVRHGAEGPIVDVGCGEGYYSAMLASSMNAELVGLDISKDAVRYAAVRNKRAVFLTATASHLPFADGSFDVLSSMFALTLPAEFARVLRPGGRFLQVTAGEDHLLGLKSVIYPELHHKEKHPETELPGFILEETRMLEFDFSLETNAAVMQLLAMTPHYLRITKEGLARAQATERLTDRAQVCFRVYRRSADVL